MNSLRARFGVDLLLFAVAAAWGSTYLVAKELVTPDSVIALLAGRMLLAAALMALIVVVRRSSRRRNTSRWQRRGTSRSELGVGLVLGALLAAVFAFETFGIAHTSATNAGLIISLTMVFTPVLEAAVYRHRLSRGFLLAAVTAVTGVALLAGVGAFRMPSLGDLLVLAAAIVRALHVVAMHRLTRSRGSADTEESATLDTLTLTTVQLATCAVLFTVASLFIGVPLPAYVAGLGWVKAGLFLYLTIVCTVFAFLVQMWAVRRTSPGRVSLLLGTEPLWATAIGIGIAHDGLDPAGWCGVALVIAGTLWGRAIDQRQHERAALADTAQSELPRRELSGRLS